MRKPRTPKKKYLIHVSLADLISSVEGCVIRADESNKTRAFKTLHNLLMDAPIGSVGAVYLRNNPEAPLEDNSIERIGCHRYRSESGVTKLPHRKGKP